MKMIVIVLVTAAAFVGSLAPRMAFADVAMPFRPGSLKEQHNEILPEGSDAIRIISGEEGKARNVAVAGHAVHEWDACSERCTRPVSRAGESYEACMNAGNKALRRGQLRAAEARFREALDIAKAFCTNDPRLVESISFLARVLERIGHVAPAEQLR